MFRLSLRALLLALALIVMAEASAEACSSCRPKQRAPERKVDRDTLLTRATASPFCSELRLRLRRSCSDCR